MPTSDYTVKIYACPVPFPFTLFAHTYLVLEYGGVIERYELMPMRFRNHPKVLDAYIFKDLLPPDVGFRWFGKYPFNFGPRYNIRHISISSGQEGSPAHKLYKFISAGGLHNYPHKNTYNMILGPNSNSFVQWVINRVPECNLWLPWNAWGKNVVK